jgi:PAS domain S-box-containing protein
MKIKTKLYLIMAVLAVALVGEILLTMHLLTIPMQRKDIVKKAWQYAYSLQEVAPMLNQDQMQQLVSDMVERDPQLSYLLVLDQDGKAIVHSEPNRIGMIFNDAGTLSCTRYGKSLQQIYTRDSDQPASSYRGERTIDILIPNFDKEGNHIGAINIGVSMEYLSQMASRHYRAFFICGAVLLLIFYLATRKLYRDIISPLNETVDAIRRVKSGNYDEINIEERQDELGLLACEFNSMASRIAELMADLKEAHEDLENRVKQRTTELAAEKERLDVTLSSIAEGVVSIGLDGIIVLGNETAAKIVGVNSSDLLGKNIQEFLQVPIREVDFNKRIINQDTVIELSNHRIIAQDGSERLVDAIGSPIQNAAGEVEGMVWVIRDITDRQRFEEELIKAAKLESLGILAGGLAHDFNNLLTVIAGNISLARMMSEETDGSGEFLHEAEKATLQARDLAQQLLTFSRGGQAVKNTVSTTNFLRNSVNFALSGSNVSCEFIIPEQLWNVEIDEGRISQVLNNLVINAIQAMPKGGTIRISAENVDIDNPDEKVPLAAGKYVMLSIADQGTGILEKYYSRIFDPYFTTKENGSGLGLATSKSIIHQHGGYLTYDSRLGKGTVFYVYLPASQQDYENKDTIPIQPVKGQGRVLIMEDESVRRILKDMLVSLGYEVDIAIDGKELIELYRNALQLDKKYNAVIMDPTVGGSFGGSEVIQSLLPVDRGAILIASSGYSTKFISYQEMGYAAVITKPYGIKDLSKVLQDLL